MAEKMNKKELRQPDALQRAGLEARSWIEGKEKLVLGAVIALVLVGFGIALANYLGERSERQASQALGAALEPIDRPVQAGDTPPPADTPADKKPFASQKEKDEAIVASLTKFRSDYAGTRPATTAALPLAQAQYRLGQYDEALKAYAAYLEGAPKDDPLRAVALEGQGYAHEAKGELDKALASFEELAELKTDDFLVGMGQFHKARILIAQGKKDEAAKALSEIPSAFPNSAAARMATERMNLLASEGVRVPPPAPPAAPGGSDAGTSGS